MKPALDPKRRNDIVDEAFLEQKDILLEMLEAKLKEVRDKRKRKQDPPSDGIKCENLPKNIDLKMKAQGLSAVGDTEAFLKFGESGNSSLVLESTGISNVGRAHVQLDVGDGAVHIPGLHYLFSGAAVRSVCEKQNKSDIRNEMQNKQLEIVDDDLESRRQGSNATDSKTIRSKATKESSKSAAKVTAVKTTKTTTTTEVTTIENTSPIERDAD
ncbi:unnamed protein product [Colias eurytheme]|nr:unnamed protein product [Colias eurytheme]